MRLAPHRTANTSYVRQPQLEACDSYHSSFALMARPEDGFKLRSAWHRLWRRSLHRVELEHCKLHTPNHCNQHANVSPNRTRVIDHTPAQAGVHQSLYTAMPHRRRPLDITTSHLPGDTYR